MFNVRYKSSTKEMLNSDIISPDIAYAKFDDGLCVKTAKNICNTINHGSQMLTVYETMRDNLHLLNIVDMLKKMEDIFNSYDVERFKIKKSK